MAEVVLRPGGPPFRTTEASITVAAMQQGGTFVFTVVVTDDAGLSSSASWQVVVRPG